MLRTLVRRLLGRQSPENPSTPLSNADSWYWGGGHTSSSGVTVTPATALAYAAVWRAVNMISRDVAKIPIEIYRETDAGKEIARSHPARFLLRRRANPYQTTHELKRVLQAHALLRGNGYAWIERNGATPTALYAIDPDRTTPIRTESGRLVYEYQPTTGESVFFDGSDVLHIRGLTYDGVLGLSPIQAGTDAIGLALAQQEYGNRYFNNSSRASVVLEHPNKISDDAAKRLRESWERVARGLDNAHRTVVLEEGMKASQMTINAKDSQLIESRNFQVREIANLFGVPPHKLADPARTSYASVEAEETAYLVDTLDGWFVTWEQELESKLLTERSQRGDVYDIEYTRNALVRADMGTRFEAYSKAVGEPWMSRNEARARENLNAIDDAAFDVPSSPLNMGGTPDEEEDSSGTDPGSTGEDAAGVDETSERGQAPELETVSRSALGCLAAEGRRMAKRLQAAARQAAKRPHKLELFLSREISESHRSVIVEAFEAPSELLLGLGGSRTAVELADRLVELARDELRADVDVDLELAVLPVLLEEASP